VFKTAEEHLIAKEMQQQQKKILTSTTPLLFRHFKAISIFDSGKTFLP